MDIIIRPIITEKATKLSEGANKYSFVVAKNVNKIQIKAAIEGRYDVSVDAVNTLNYAPKRKSKYTRRGVQQGKSSAYKKAVVLVSEGQSIDFYSNL